MLKGETEMNLFGKKFALVLALIAVFAMAGSALAADVTDESSLRQQAEKGGEITLTGDIELTGSGDEGALNITKDTVLDLNGHMLSRTSDEAGNTFVIIVKDKATLTINDSSNGNGEIVSTNTHGDADTKGYSRVIKIGSSTYNNGDGTGGTVVMNGGNLQSAPVTNPAPDAWGGYGVVLYANGSAATDKTGIDVTFIMNGGKIEAGWSGIAVFGTGSKVSIKDGEIIAPGYAIAGNGNGQNNGTTIDIEGGTLTSENDVAVYHPQAGVMTVSGGTITGQDGIQMIGGELNITGGTIRAIGEYSETYVKDEDGSILGGAALSILSRADYVGHIVVNISGTPVLESKNGNAIAEATVNNAANENKFEKLIIEGGTFTSAASLPAIAKYFAEPGDITITAGTFSSDIREIFPNHPEAFGDIEIAENNGKFYVVIHSESISLPATKEITVGTSERLEVTFTPENTTETTLKWSSSDESIVTVDDNGIVTAASVGTADITARAGNGKTATCRVTVMGGAPQHGSGGGGCSAGFGALALLAAVPLMFRRKK